MNMITMIRIETGAMFQGFIDRDKLTHILNFYYYDHNMEKWVSDNLLNFKPIPFEVKENKVIGG